jgi:aspartate/methionine/tyrosine aminotransferase
MQWMNEHELTAKYNLAETCSASISVEELQALSAEKSTSPLSFSKKLDYGSITGSEKLRKNLADLYSAKTPTPLPADNVLITPGAIMANFLLIYSLVGPGDHVICVYPTYQQLYSVPASVGAEVSLWRSREEEKWRLDLDDLKSLIKPNTKLIILK